jgi:hypothetical protein
VVNQSQDFAARSADALLQQRLAEDLPPADAVAEPSIAQLLGNLIADGQSLVRKEFELARHEIALEVDKARQGAISLGIGAGIATIGSLFLLLALAHGLVALFNLPLGLAYLIVGFALAVIGGLLLLSGSNRLKQLDPIPHETIDSVRKDVTWLKEQSPSDKI